MLQTLIIDGRNLTGEGPTIHSHNPADQSRVSSARGASAAQVVAAVDAADRALAHWRDCPLDHRIKLVRRFGRILEAEREALADLITRETGKLMWDSRGEVKTCIAKVELSIRAVQERRSPTADKIGDAWAEVRHRPLGVVLVLGPFNFPAHLPGGQIIPALIAGNTIVFKPSELTPAVGSWIGDAWRRAGLAPGVLNVIHGGADVAGAAIDDRRIAGVMFTGSHRAGTVIHSRLAGRPEVLLALEMGGNNPLVIAPPLEPYSAAGLVVASAFTSSGQRCTCARRLVVVDDPRSSAVVDALVDRIPRLRLGLPGDVPEPFIGPLVSVASADAVLAAHDRMLEQGGQSLVRMERSPRSPALLTPGLVDVTGTAAEWDDDEHFGPLLRLIRVADFDAALDAASNTRFGLAAALVGGNREQFERFRTRVPAGVINWNRQTTGASGSLPFGGLGHSGNHRPAGYWAIDACADPVASLVSEAIDDEGFDRSQL